VLIFYCARRGSDSERCSGVLVVSRGFVQSWNLSSASSQILYGAIRGAAARTVASLQIGSSNRKTTRAVLRLFDPSFVQLLHNTHTQSEKVL
jgi:hypothetical protein